MTQLKTQSDFAWQDFISHCHTLNSEDELAEFFDTFLTSTEKFEFANRLKIIKELLRDEKTQRDIARDLKVSLANVTRGSNVLKTSKYDLKKLLKIEK